MIEEAEVPQNSEVTDSKWFLLVEEFRSRHAEILHYQNETKQIVFWSVASTGALWAWIVENKSNTEAELLLSIVVFLPLIIVIYCGLRWRLLEHFIQTNSEYIREHIENHFPVDNQGWENYLWCKQDAEADLSFMDRNKKKLQYINRYLSISLWFLLLGFNVLGIYLNF